MSEKSGEFEQIKPEFRENEQEKKYREIREEFVRQALEGQIPNRDLIKRMKDAARELGARADMINEDVAKQNMTPEQRQIVENRKSELNQAAADKTRENIKRWQQEEK
ncbi:MAG: hypothetical protein A3A94_02980 [Candidatus Portnoybacteria bacterium RIFCSPLOWO2_01_FULL_43_11]|uniref:Uncharacterized protein n=2 Tax=Candidatus Portnoyibacteriota TaxID=1817913 RepID=A0A1G2FSJ0_9BACT|nr:MAG: hypothetical protein A3A94_02980 [Candidatus Portnoybacteria bacterium RIFCSPLOWO2_01_FULL_43_11]OGZ41003.1 MAG: hypothetical protein A3I20_01185 [Candidatus Portnoybacteria bacterium RIFCSPLOWO2_02_FULL_40_15]